MPFFNNLIKYSLNLCRVLGIVLLLTNTCFSQTVYKEFVPTDYAASDYKTKIQSIPFNNLTIKLIKINHKGYENENAFYCRAWLKVIRNDSTIDSLYFDNITAGKGCAGLYMDNKQPDPNHFILTKFGDYDGRTLIINKQGQIKNITGGKYFITRDKRYLFSIYESDLSGIAVFDFRYDKLTYSNNAFTSKLTEWYFQEGRYFSLDQEGDEEEVETENPNYNAMFFTIQYFDFVKRTMKKDKLNFENLRQENAIELQPTFKRAPDCLCK